MKRILLAFAASITLLTFSNTFALPTYDSLLSSTAEDMPPPADSLQNMPAPDDSAPDMPKPDGTASNIPPPDDTPASNAFEGFYAGGSLGYDSISYDNTGNATSVDFEQLVVTSSVTLRDILNADKQKNAFLATLHFGYGVPLSENFYIGVDTSLSISSNTKKELLSEADSSAINAWNSKLSNRSISNLSALEFNFDFNPGIFISSNTLLYGVVGVAVTQMKYTLTSHFLRSSAADAFIMDRTVSSTVKKLLAGFRAGIGIKQIITPQLALFLQYAYTQYGKASTSSSATYPLVTNGGAPPTPAGTPSDSLENSGSTKATSNSIIFGVDWYFME